MFRFARRPFTIQEKASLDRLPGISEVRGREPPTARISASPATLAGASQPFRILSTLSLNADINHDTSHSRPGTSWDRRARLAWRGCNTLQWIPVSAARGPRCRLTDHARQHRTV